jgi:hypothetical protein
MKTLWTPIDGCFQAHSRIMMTVMMQQPKSLYINRAVSIFHGTEIEIWAGFGRAGSQSHYIEVAQRGVSSRAIQNHTQF